MTPSDYHKSYSDQSTETTNHKLEVKQQELKKIFEEISPSPSNNPVRVAVLGCGDKRFVDGHKRIFEELLQRSVELTTFDITTNHLEGKENVVKHDCTLPLPSGPFDITYAHVLLKFIQPDKQFALIQNSFDALNSGGIAIHILDSEEIDNPEIHVEGDLWSVPLSSYKEQLRSANIVLNEVPLEYGLALVLVKK